MDSWILNYDDQASFLNSSPPIGRSSTPIRGSPVRRSTTPTARAPSDTSLPPPIPPRLNRPVRGRGLGRGVKTLPRGKRMPVYISPRESGYSSGDGDSSRCRRSPRRGGRSPRRGGAGGGGGDDDDDDGDGDDDDERRENLLRRLQRVQQRNIQNARGRHVAGVTHTNTITTTYKDGGRPTVNRSSNTFSP